MPAIKFTTISRYGQTRSEEFVDLVESRGLVLHLYGLCGQVVLKLSGSRPVTEETSVRIADGFRLRPVYYGDSCSFEPNVQSRHFLRSELISTRSELISTQKRQPMELISTQKSELISIKHRQSCRCKRSCCGSVRHSTGAPATASHPCQDAPR